MTFKSKIISAMTAGTAIIAFSTFVSAQETTKTDNPTPTPKQERKMRNGEFGKRGMGKGMRGGRFGRRGGMMMGFRGLNLTDEQKAQIKTIMETNRASLGANREEMRTIMTAKRDGTITAEQQQRLDAFKTQMRENAKSTHQQVLNVLTAEQRAQLEARKAEMKQRREERQKMRQERKQNPTPEPKKDN